MSTPSSSSSSSSSLLLSENWKLIKSHQSIYTGGKVELSPDQQSIACLCNDGVALFNINTGERLLLIKASQDEDNDDSILSFTFHPSGNHLLITTSRSHQIKLFSINPSIEINSIKGHLLPMLDICYHSSGLLFGTASADRSIRIYNAEKLFITHSFKGHSSVVNKIIFHPIADKLIVFSASDDGEIRAWNLRNQECHVLSGHQSSITSFDFHSNGNQLITSSRDKFIIIWNLIDYTATLTLPIYEEINAVVWLKSGLSFPSMPVLINNEEEKYFITSGERGIIKIYDSQEYQCVYQHAMPNAALNKTSDDIATKNELSIAINYLFLRPDDKQLIAVTGEHNFYFYNLNDFSKQKLIVGFNDEIIDIKPHPDQKRVFVATNSSQIRVFDLETFDADIIAGHRDTVLSIDISRDGDFLVSTGKDLTVRFWDIRQSTPQCLAICEGHTEAIGTVAFSNSHYQGNALNQIKLFAVSGARDRTIKLWDAKGLLTANNNNNTPTISAIHSKLAHTADINCIRISPNDSIVASASQDKIIRLWKSDDLSLITSLRGHKRGVWCLAFSTVDKVLASGSGDKTIRIWSMNDYTCLKTFEGHSGSILSLSFFNHGMQLLSASADSSIRLWTIKTNECVNTFDTQHQERIWSLSLLSDGKKMITGGADSLINIWIDNTALEKQEAMEAEKQRIEKEQNLLNLIHIKKYDAAIILAIDLQQPRRLLLIINELLQSSQSDILLNEILSVLSEDHLNQLLLYIRDWNTSAKTSSIAQQLLYSLLKNISPSVLLKNRSLRESLDALLLYSERHFQRLDKLIQRSYLFDYTLDSMNLLAGNGPVIQLLEQEENSK